MMAQRTKTSAQQRKIDEMVQRCRENAWKAAGLDTLPVHDEDSDRDPLHGDA